MKRRLLFLALWPLIVVTGFAKLSPLAPTPDWSKLAAYQDTITHDNFAHLLEGIYAPNGASRDVITVSDDLAMVKTHEGAPPFLLRFAPSQAATKSVTTYWRSRAELPAVEPGKPLAGLKIVLDPGHLGGDWAKMEERWFQMGKAKPVQEGDMTLYVAKLLVPRLEALGAELYLTRSKNGPTTSLRPKQLLKAAASSLADSKTPKTAEALRKESERLFYRVAEIRHRAQLVNETIRPDLVLCLHFNAEAWGNEKKPELVDVDHMHFLITGDLSAEELADEDQRYDMLVKLLDRSFLEEQPLTDTIAKSMAAVTGLPPYVYHEAHAIRVDDNPYVWARNLLANRLFSCPVVYVEPYVQNSRLVFARIQAGDYNGTKKFGGVLRKSIYREYADGIVEGLVAYYSNRSL